MDDTQVVRSFLSAMRRRRPLAMLRLTTPDFLLSLPAESPRIGGREHCGRWAAARAIAKISWLSRGTLSIEPERVELLDGRVEVAARVTARRGRERLDHRMRFSFLVRDHRVAEVRESAFDLDAWHAFWG